jgi:hypothetical protein
MDSAIFDLMPKEFPAGSTSNRRSVTSLYSSQQRCDRMVNPLRR